MIDPTNFTQYDLDREELEEVILFCCCVAGKNAMTTAKALDTFLLKVNDAAYGYPDSPGSPLSAIQDCLEEGINIPIMLKESGLGCYNNRAKTFEALVAADLRLDECDTEELEEIPGIGMKTSRYFILHTREDAEVAPIDTHVMKYLFHKGVTKSPKAVLSTKRYLELEKEYINLWKECSPKLTLAEFDLKIWNQYSGHKEKAKRKKGLVNV